MEDSKKKINKLKEKILDFGKKIIDWVIKEIEKIELFLKNNDFHIKFNKNIIKLFNYDNLNYYSILNLKNLNFNPEIDKLYSNVNINKITDILEDLSFHLKNPDYNNLQPKVMKISENCHFILKDNKAIMNMWISKNYCENWGYNEGIREFLQNQYDAIIQKINKKNLIVNPTGKPYNINNFDSYINYSFENISENNKEYGGINYDIKNNILTIWNNGELSLGHFLLGSLKYNLNNPDIIGKFGEGMKLGILGLCRLKKKIKIISNQYSYSFYFKQDKKFLQNNVPQECLFCEYEKYPENNMNNKVQIEIYNIELEEWASQVNNYLWLLKNSNIYPAVDNYNNWIGDLLLEPIYANRIYVKGIYVQDLGKNKKEFNDLQFIPGFNVNVELNRDRNCVCDNYYLKNLTSKILSKIINANSKYFQEIYSKKNTAKQSSTNIKQKEISEKNEIKEIPNKIIKDTDKINENNNLNTKNFVEKAYFNNNKNNNENIINNNENNKNKNNEDNKNKNIINNNENNKNNNENIINNNEDNKNDKENKNNNNGKMNKENENYINSLPKRIIDCLSGEKTIFDGRTISDYLTKEGDDVLWNEMNQKTEVQGKQPTSNERRILEFIEDKKLEKNFYDYYIVSYDLMCCIEKSSYYISIETKYINYIKNIETINPPKDYLEAISDIVSKINIIKPQFKMEQIVFKKFKEKVPKEFYYKNDDKLYFNSQKLSEEINKDYKYWFIIKIIKCLDIIIDNASPIFESLFAKNLPNEEIIKKIVKKDK